MEIITTAVGWEFLVRWLHFLSGVAWIGMLWYFNFVQTPFFGSELGGGVKGAMTRGLVPNALWWFRWGAMFTFLTGLTILSLKLHQGNTLGSGYMTRILTGGLMGTFPPACDPSYWWRRGCDSNPRYGVTRTLAFQASAVDHSATSPLIVILVLTRRRGTARAA